MFHLSLSFTPLSLIRGKKSKSFLFCFLRIESPHDSVSLPFDGRESSLTYSESVGNKAQVSSTAHLSSLYVMYISEPHPSRAVNLARLQRFDKPAGKPVLLVTIAPRCFSLFRSISLGQKRQSIFNDSLVQSSLAQRKPSKAFIIRALCKALELRTPETRVIFTTHCISPTNPLLPLAFLADPPGVRAPSRSCPSEPYARAWPKHHARWLSSRGT